VREVIEPLGRIAGVRLAVLVSPDGVPVVLRGQRAEDGDDADSLAALATSWMSSMARTVAPLSWEAPTHAVLRADRGTLVMLQAPGAVLTVLLDSGTQPSDLRLPMEGAVARMSRVLRSNRSRSSNPAQDSEASDPMISGALPERAPDDASGSAPNETYPTSRLRDRTG